MPINNNILPKIQGFLPPPQTNSFNGATPTTAFSGLNNTRIGQAVNSVGNVVGDVGKGIGNLAVNAANYLGNSPSTPFTPTTMFPYSPIIASNTGLLNPDHASLHQNISGGATPISTKVVTDGQGSTTSTATYPPGSSGNAGPSTPNGALPNSQNGIQVGGPGYVAPTPVGGNITTPSGATVNSGTGALVSSAPTTPYAQGVSTLLNLGATTPPATSAYEAAAQQGAQQSAQIGSNAALAEQSLYTGGGPSAILQGNAATVAQTAAARQAAISQGLNLQQGASQAAQTQLGTQEAATAAGTTAVSPQLGTVGTQTYYNPVTGQTVTGGTNTPAAGGIAQGEAAVGASLPALSQGLLAAQSTQADINNLITTKNLNPYIANAANSINQWAQGSQLSDPSYNELIGDLNHYVSQIAPILGAAGIQTDAKTYLAQQMLDPSNKGSTITQVLDNINTLLNQTYTAAQKAAYGAQPAGSSGTSGGNAVTSSVFPGTTYSQVNGVWTATQT